MRLVRPAVLATVCVAMTVLAGCGGQDAVTPPDRQSSTSLSFPKTTPEQDVGGTGTDTGGGGDAGGGAGGSSPESASGGGPNGAGSASRDLAFSLAEPAPSCTGKTVRQANGPQCYVLGEELLAAPLVSNVRTLQDRNNRPNWSIELTLFSKFSDALRQITKQNTGKQMAITYRGEVLSAPVIAGEITGGVVLITGSFTKKQAEDFAAQLRGS